MPLNFTNLYVLHTQCMYSASIVVATQVLGDNSPIFLEQLDCTSSDSNLLECNSFSARGIHSCTHQQDVSVQCTGEWETVREM